jgi:putative spermidine/putrescine transport system substrate-binding protein
VSNARVPGATAARVGFTEDEQTRLITPNDDYLAKNESQLKEWWDKVFRA